MSLKLVHISKTAGTSISDTYPELVISHHCHAPEMLQRYSGPTFCVFRNPLDRFISAYKFIFKVDDKEVFNERVSEILSKDLSHYMCNLFTPQVNYIYWVNHIIKFDRLDVELPLLLKQYNIKPKPLLHRLKTPVCKNLIMNDENTKLFEEVYKRDLEFYKYL